MLEYFFNFSLILGLALATYYTFLNLSLGRALQRYFLNPSQLQDPSKLSEKPSLKPFVSVIISARNEEDHIERCLNQILNQKYGGHFEVLVANDRSSDQTEVILQKFKDQHVHFDFIRIEHIDPRLSPKKNALTQLIQKSQGEILLLTDADCFVGENWISSIIDQFKPGVMMVLGFSHFEPHPNRIFYHIQGLEFLSYAVASAAFAQLHFPMTSTGNNLAYRKALWSELDGFSGVEHIMSGDDDLLLHKARQKFPQGIIFNTNPQSYVSTEPQQSWERFWEQRKRWASKTIYYTPIAIVILGLIFAFYLTIATTLCLGFFNPLYFEWGLTLWIWKTISDYFVIKKGAQLFKKEELLVAFFPTSVMHIPLILFAVIFGVLGKFSWKK